MDVEKVLAQKKRRQQQLLAMALESPLNERQTKELAQLSLETGVPVYWQVFHFGLGYYSPTFACRERLMAWVREMDDLCLKQAKQSLREKLQRRAEENPKKKRKGAGKKKAPKRQRDALEAVEIEQPFGLFSLEESYSPDLVD